jgi:hypothetical protein
MRGVTTKSGIIKKTIYGNNAENERGIMPAIDECEPQMLRALAKDDWAVINQPLTLRSGIARKQLFADLYLQKMTTKEQIIVVEIKCFPESRSRIDKFYHAIGQYQVYRVHSEMGAKRAKLVETMKSKGNAHVDTGSH